MTTQQESSMTLFCAEHGRVHAPLVRGDHRYGEVTVRQALAHVCPTCGSALAFPSSSSGRIAQAMREHEPLQRLEVRVHAEVMDQALAVHAVLGTLGAGEPFTLPLHLGLQVAGRESKPKPSWRVHDGSDCPERARPLVTASTARRLEGLKKAWGARSVGQVARWLVVAAAEAVQAGLSSQQGTPAPVLELLTSSVQVESVYQARVRGAAIHVAEAIAPYCDPKVA